MRPGPVPGFRHSRGLPGGLVCHADLAEAKDAQDIGRGDPVLEPEAQHGDAHLLELAAAAPLPDDGLGDTEGLAEGRQVDDGGKREQLLPGERLDSPA